MSVTVEAGKRYEATDGTIMGPMIARDGDMIDRKAAFFCQRTGWAYRVDGRINHRPMAHLDLIAEVPAAPAQCCMCGKTGLSTAEDGGPARQTGDAMTTESQDSPESVAARELGAAIEAAAMAWKVAYARAVALDGGPEWVAAKAATRKAWRTLWDAIGDPEVCTALRADTPRGEPDAE